MKIITKKEGNSLAVSHEGKSVTWRNGCKKEARFGKFFIAAVRRGKGVAFIIKKKGKVIKKVHLKEDGEVTVEL